MKSIAEEVAALRALPVSELIARYELAFGQPPRVRHREYLWKRVGWKIQEQRFGGLSTAAKDRLEGLIAQIDIPIDEHMRTATGRLLARPTATTGATLVKNWRGTEYRATPVQGGYEVNGVLHRSLSAAAQAITGTKWNGRLFFGLTKTRRAQ
jgi:hypothetical protein